MNKNTNNTETDKRDNRKKDEEEISEYGTITLEENDGEIRVLTIIGEIERHECLGANTKTTKYEHMLPMLAQIEQDRNVKGVLLLINTVGGDVSAGLSLAEMVASLSVPKVALVLGDSHSIGVPLAVAADYTYIVPSGTMIVHPVRMNGTVIGAPQTYEYFKLIQDRIVGFISTHSKVGREKLEQMMLKSGILTKDLGTILVGREAVEAGLCDETGGIAQAIAKLKEICSLDKN